MSYQEKNITVSLFSHLLIGSYYLANLLPMIQSGELVAGRLYALWSIVIAVNIVVNIIASILTNILLTIVEAIQSRKYEDPQFIADERDNLIGLKGIRSTYLTFSIGVLLSVFAFIYGQPPLMMISLIVLFSILAEIIGDVSKIYLYRRGG
jgi:DMSO reductase anchor subunit